MNNKLEEQEEKNQRNLNLIQTQNAKDQQKLMAEYHKKAEEEREKLKNEFEKNMAEQEEMHAEKLAALMKIVDKKHYESRYPIPGALRNHLDANERCFNIQILGSRGAGKSTLVNSLLRQTGTKGKANTGVNECTIETQFFDITRAVNNKPDRYNKVFLCDQPGIGGLKITEANYLAKYGPGKCFCTKT